jgi:hypothetical protein
MDFEASQMLLPFHFFSVFVTHSIWLIRNERNKHDEIIWWCGIFLKITQRKSLMDDDSRESKGGR